jgi:hypothetical protein
MTQGEREMIDFNGDLMTKRTAALVFALMAAMSAVSSAVAPAIIHI